MSSDVLSTGGVAFGKGISILPIRDFNARTHARTVGPLAYGSTVGEIVLYNNCPLVLHCHVFLHNLWHFQHERNIKTHFLSS